ncbi:hypothetical protein [Phenylobacterium sp.]|uniref:hypothetical protein n=1 Tax=Phenylobacterium sp. TaxID=1871053 RepID=UPI002C258892|nr:hypothetical protein [Phenylobacterium sp.]HVI30728.1 hypothetical protein [Phenylobacterium sp.]
MAFRIGTIAADVAHFGRRPAVAPVAAPAAPARREAEPRAAAAHRAEATLAAFAPAALDALIQLQSRLPDRDDGRHDRGERAHEAIEDVLDRLRDRWGQKPRPPKPPVTPPPVTPPPVVVQPPVTPPPVTPPPVTPPPVVVQPPVTPPPPPKAPVVDSPYPAQRLRAVLEEIRKPVVSPETTKPFSQREAAAGVAPLTVSREQAITLRSLGAAYQGQAALAVMKVAGADATAFQRSLWA